MRKTLLAIAPLIWAAAALGQDSATEARITRLIGRMTLREKVNMIHAASSFTSGGVPRLGIPELVTSDGPHGVRLEHGRGWDDSKVHVFDSATYLPVGVCLASTWNPELGYLQGSVLGSESNWRGKDMQLGPGINIIRTPLNGRNFEYMSEDPYLISRMVVGEIRGMQDQGIAACVKHFLANNQETWRTKIDVRMSDRALREIYLPGFEAAVKEGHVLSVMGSYNKFRGQYCAENAFLIDTILKGEWGFRGVLVSDWGAVHNTMEALENGTDLEMGTDLSQDPIDYHKFYMGDTVIALVRSGRVPESLIDDKVRRILRVLIATHKLDHDRKPGSFDTRAHQEATLRIAEQGIVLLKNENHLLPLSGEKIRSVAVIGANADRVNAMGGGSSQVRALFEITPLQGLTQELGSGVSIRFCPGYRIARGAQADPGLIRQAVEAASHADVAVIVGGWTHGYDYRVWKDNAYDAEDVDKPDMDMPFGQDALIRAVLKANPRTVVVLMGGGPLDITSWVDNAPAIIEAWYPGMEGGRALARILLGRVDPSGKLPMTFPRHLADVPAEKLGEYPGNGVTETYNEGIYVGYRYYDTYHVDPLFPFGHGLSYTTFAYDDLHLSATGDSVTVRFRIRNTGSRFGGEVAQVYVHEDTCSVDRPEKELKGFRKVFLEAGASATVTVTLPESAFEYYNDGKKNWVLEPGRFTILVGSSSRDIRLKGFVEL